MQAGKNDAMAALATTKQRLQEAQTVALAGTGAGPISLKIVGVGGLNQVEARDKYLASREKLMKNHVALVKAKQQRSIAVAKVAAGTASGVDPKALTLQELSLEEEKYDIASDGRGKIVLDNKTEVTAVPVPKELVPPMTESRAAILSDWHRWTQKDSVIKRFPLIVPEIRYMISAVDPIEAMHMLPPDRLEGWAEKDEFEIQLGLEQGSDTTAVVDAYNAERMKQWDDFYTLATCQPVQHIEQFIQIAHPVGQTAAKVTEVKHNGQNFLHVILAQLVPFDSNMQAAALTTLNNLASKWNGAKAIASIDMVRAELQSAAEMGVTPSYEMSLEPLIHAICTQNPEMYAVLQQGKLHTSNIQQHQEWSPDRNDCTTVFYQVLAMVRHMVEKEQHADDAREGSSKRKRPGIDARKATVRPKSTLGGRINHLMNQQQVPREHRSSKSTRQSPSPPSAPSS